MALRASGRPRGVLKLLDPGYMSVPCQTPNTGRASRAAHEVLLEGLRAGEC